MSRFSHTLLFVAVLLSLASCGDIVSGPRQSDPSDAITSLIEQADKEVKRQNYDTAMEKALSALDLSRREGSALGEVNALSSIVGIDIMTSRDADAWEKAVEAEDIAREHGLKKELSGILISKAKLCSYAEISPETGRNDEGLSYVQEALRLAEETQDAEHQAEACYVTGSLYINKNRWSDPIDLDIYDTAGRWLDQGQAIADSLGNTLLKRNGILFRSRWFQQGNRNEDAIRYFEQARDGLDEKDYVTASALDDRLVRLYTREGDYQKALNTHDDYVFLMQKYIQQKQDETLQEMETRFEVKEKERRLERSRYQAIILILALLLSGAVIALTARKLRQTSRRASDLQRINDSKELIIELLSKDLKNPANTIAEEIAKLSSDATALEPDQIREKCLSLAAEAKTINTDVADYVGDILIERSRKIADIGLSQREIQIIRLSAEGLRASEIAERLFLSVHTVNTHRQRIYSKMEVKNVSELIRKATELGII